MNNDRGRIDRHRTGGVQNTWVAQMKPQIAAHILRLNSKGDSVLKSLSTLLILVQSSNLRKCRLLGHTRYPCFPDPLQHFASIFLGTHGTPQQMVYLISKCLTAACPTWLLDSHRWLVRHRLQPTSSLHTKSRAQIVFVFNYCGESLKGDVWKINYYLIRCSTA